MNTISLSIIAEKSKLHTKVANVALIDSKLCLEMIARTFPEVEVSERLFDALTRARMS
jgi:hypothetical protein